MTGMLASVNSVEEALLALSANVDIIDLKQPALGALGALKTDIVKNIVVAINGRCPISATVGDLPMQPEIVYQAVTAMAETGVDYIKIGFFPGGDWQGTIEKLATFPQTINLIAVLFADTQPDLAVIDSLAAPAPGKLSAYTPSMAIAAPVPDWPAAYTPSMAIAEPVPDRFSAYTPSMAIAAPVPDWPAAYTPSMAIKNSGFKGVMLDTMNKTNGSLTQVMAKADIAQFVRLAKNRKMLCGLAGSLRLDDIAELILLQPDYLGFRGALCLDHNRTAQLNSASIRQIKQAIDQN